MTTSSEGHLSVVQYLVSNGANINYKNQSGETALILASQKDQLPIL